MISELTPAQTSQISTVRDEWLRAFFSLPRVDRAKTEKWIEWLYGLAKLDKPMTIFVSSPLAAQYAVALATALLQNDEGAQVRDQVGDQVWDQVGDQVWDQVGDQVWDQVGDQVWDQVRDQVRAQVRDQVGDQVRAQVGDQVWDQVGAQVWDQVRDQVWAQVGAQVRAQVWDQVGDQVGDQVRDQVGDQVGAQVWDQVGDQVRDQVWAQVRAQVGDQVRDQVWAQVRAQVGDQVGDQVWAQVRAQVRASGPHSFAYAGSAGWNYGWLAWSDFFINHTDVQINADLRERWNEYAKLKDCQSFDMIQFQNLCIVCEFPKAIHRNAQTRMHSTEAPAIEWEDGYKLWYLHGINFEFELWDSIVTGKKHAKEILTLPNIEQRMAALRCLGAEKLINELNAAIVDTSERGNILYRIPNFCGDGDDAYALRYSCPSTGREYVSFVDDEIVKRNKERLADRSMAWKHNLSLAEYDSLQMES